jgi:hypothetical protein
MQQERGVAGQPVELGDDQRAPLTLARQMAAAPGDCCTPVIGLIVTREF